MRFNSDLIRHRLEFARAIDQHQYEVSPEGIYFPRQQAFVAGQFDTWINDGDHQVDPNIVPIEALNYLLKTGLTNVGGLSNWYVAPYANNVVPAANLTAANFTATMGEFATYTELTRPAFVVPADPTNGVFANTAAPAVITAGAVGAGGVDIFGAAILSASAKNAITGKLFCCSPFSAARKLFETDKLTTEYTVSAVSA